MSRRQGWRDQAQTAWQSALNHALYRLPRMLVTLRSLLLPNALASFINAVLARNEKAEDGKEKLH